MSAAASSAASPTEDPDTYVQSAAPPPLWSRAFIDLLIAEALFGFSYAQFVLLPKLLTVGYGATAGQIGRVMGAFGVASLLTIPFIAPAVKRFNYRRTMIAGYLVLGASALAFLSIGSAGTLAAVLRGAQGIAWSLTFAAGMALVADIAPPARLGHAIGLYGAAALAMSALGPAVAEPIATHYGAHAVFVLSAVFALAGAWFCRRLSPTVSSSQAAEKPAPGLAGRRTAVIAVLAVGSLAAAAVSTFVAPFALTRGIHVVRGFFIVYTLTALVMRVAGTRLTDRLGQRRAAIAGAAGYGFVMIAMGSAGPGRLALLGGLFGLAHGIVFPALMALVLSESSTEERPRLLAITNGAINLGITGVGVIGAIADRVGYPAVFLVAGVVTTATAGLLVPSRRSRSPASASST
jgi:MFS family permease